MDEFHAIGALRHRDGRAHRRGDRHGQPARLRRQPGRRRRPPDERFNRAVTGMYEPGSTFKLQTAAMALDSGVGASVEQLRRRARHPYRPLHHHRLRGQAPRAWPCRRCSPTPPTSAPRTWRRRSAPSGSAPGCRRMGMFDRIGIELPEAGQPIVPPAANWKEVATLTIGFGHGIAVSPLHVVRGTAAIANGGVVLRPTILAPEPGMAPRDGHAGDAAVDLGHDAQADAAGGDRRLRQARRRARLLRRRQDRHGGEERRPRLQEARQRQRVHERVPDERAALRGLFHAGRAEGQRQHRRLLHRRLGERARRRAG